MLKGLFSQLIMIALAIGIVVTYVQPTFVALGETQDTVATYREEQRRIAFVNQQLDDLNSSINNLPAADIEKLDTYLPSIDEIDTVAVARDIESISAATEVDLEQVSFVGIDTTTDVSTSNTLIPHAYSVTIVASYEAMKDFFAALAHNNYPLEVHELTVSQTDITNTLQAEATLVTYAYGVVDIDNLSNN